jgi:murein DD-endopeptidase MepM/ murein hydrolase activator NlpD
MGRVAVPRTSLRLCALGILLVAWGLLACAGSSDRGVVHVLKPGETVYRLSRYYGVPVRDIVRANRIRDVSGVPAGARLFVPGARREAPKRSIALASLTPTSPSARHSAKRAGNLDFVWPVRGRLSSRFGWRGKRPHEGIDIAARRGAEVRAAESGRVILAGRLGGYGRVVIVKHAGHYSSVYAHNHRNRVRKGQFVEKGQVIAEVGSSGRSSGPHLHFEIRRSQSPKDPMVYLP